MRKSRLSKGKQDRLIEHFVSGTTARCSAGLVGINFTTVAYYYYRLRMLIYLATENEANFSSEIEVDESYFGVHRTGKLVRVAQRERFLYLAPLKGG